MGGQKREGGTPWDITTGVGLIALGVAAARATESDRSDRLVNNPYTEAFGPNAGIGDTDGGLPMRQAGGM